MLHIINTSQSLATCIKFALPGHAILLIEDGVYAALSKNALSHQNHSIFALQNDLNIRGIADKISSDIKIISYEEFVELTIRYHPSQSW